MAPLCALSNEKLKEVCSGLKITFPPESKGRLVFIRALNKYLGSVFTPEQPSLNQVNRTQDPIGARLSIALQLTSSTPSGGGGLSLTRIRAR